MQLHQWRGGQLNDCSFGWIHVNCQQADGSEFKNAIAVPINDEIGYRLEDESESKK
jgi:hypothetical protein